MKKKNDMMELDALSKMWATKSSVTDNAKQKKGTHQKTEWRMPRTAYNLRTGRRKNLSGRAKKMAHGNNSPDKSFNGTIRSAQKRPVPQICRNLTQGRSQSYRTETPWSKWNEIQSEDIGSLSWRSWAELDEIPACAGWVLIVFLRCRWVRESGSNKSPSP